MTVVVLGMHRSGTSVATRLVNLLGVPLCRPTDLLRGHTGNERGHWECTPLVQENERLLRAVSARWWCPPDDSDRVASLADDEARVAAARRIFSKSYPTEQWVWKDPRLCLLLPFWRQVLPRRPVALLVHRDPAEVAASLRARSNISIPVGLALWERYVTLACHGARGLPTLVCAYTDLVADPLSWAQQVANFLTEQGIEARLPSNTAGLRAFVSGELRHAKGLAEVAEQVTPSQRCWQAYLEAFGGPADPVAAEPQPDASTIALMREVRSTYELDGKAHRNGAGTGSRAVIRVLEPPRARRIHPSGQVSVLLFPHGQAATAADADRLRPRLPADAEIVTVADAHAERLDADQAVTGGQLLTIRRERLMSLAQRLDLAANVARGDNLLVLAGAPVVPLPGWLPALRGILNAQEECAVVAPGLCTLGGSGTAYGLLVDPLLVGVEWNCAAAPSDPFPIWSASLTAFATTRRHLDSVGGFDVGLTGSGREDLDLCLRLWRSGWRCLAVPAARVEVEFDSPDAGQVDLLVNLMRLGMVHLGSEKLRKQIEYLSTCDGFSEALSRVTAGDAGVRRSVVAALSWYATEDLQAVTGMSTIDVA